MFDLLIFASVATVGYVLAIYTWPALRTAMAGVEQELVWLRSRAAELEAKLPATPDHAAQ